MWDRRYFSSLWMKTEQGEASGGNSQCSLTSIRKWFPESWVAMLLTRRASNLNSGLISLCSVTTDLIPSVTQLSALQSQAALHHRDLSISQSGPMKRPLEEGWKDSMWGLFSFSLWLHKHNRSSVWTAACVLKKHFFAHRHIIFLLTN